MTRRLKIRRLLYGAFAFLSLCSTPALHAQVIPDAVPRRDRGDTVPEPPAVDTAQARADSLRTDSIRLATLRQDSARRVFPGLVAEGPGGFAAGVWEWDRDALQREGAVTLGDLLRRIPGMQPLRAGGYVQPEAVTAFGQTRGRIQYEVDGYVLDPMETSTLDVARIELINLAGVRVERRLDVTHVKLRTAEPFTGEPYTRIEAMTGEPDMNAFRAVFLVPYVVVGPLGLAIDRVDTDGVQGRESANSLAGWGKWSWTNGNRGVQLEYRRQTIQREPAAPWPTEATRQDIILRARSRLATGLTAELFGGRSGLTREPTDTANSSQPVPDSLRIPALERGHWQGGARAAFNRGPANAGATVRIRTADALPQQEIALNAGLDVGGLVHVGGDFGYQGWSSGGSASTFDVRGQAGPVAGFSAFVEVAGGDRGAPLYADSAGVSTLESHAVNSRSGFRAGAAIDRWGIQGGAAYVKLDATQAVPFGLPFDSAYGPWPACAADGYEAWGRIGLFSNRIALDAGYTFWNEAVGWTYLPNRNWRIAGEVHLSPLASGNLEIFGRLESVRRGPMLAYAFPYGDPIEEEPTDPPTDPVVTPADGEPRFSTLPAVHHLNGYLQIRIIDVRAFIQWEDMLGKDRLDIPGRLIPGPRFFYGVKWQLFN